MKESGWDHELMRFRTMNEKQLFTRLGKITKMEKLDLFIDIAKLKDLRKLANAAEARREELIRNLNYPKMRIPLAPKPAPPKVHKTVVAPVKEKKLKRALEF